MIELGARWSLPPPSESQIFPRPQAGPRVGQGACCEVGLYCAAGSVRLLSCVCFSCVCLNECLLCRCEQVPTSVRADGLRGSADPHTRGDERPSASGCCARVVDGAGGRVV